MVHFGQSGASFRSVKPEVSDGLPYRIVVFLLRFMVRSTSGSLNMPLNTPFEQGFIDESHAIILMSPGHGEGEVRLNDRNGGHNPTVRRIQEEALLYPPRKYIRSGQCLAEMAVCGASAVRYRVKRESSGLKRVPVKMGLYRNLASLGRLNRPCRAYPLYCQRLPRGF
jgi:hypothetical protein